MYKRQIENCVNEGDNVNAFATVNSARIGNITCITAVGSKITNTVNRGNVICKTGGAAGGIVCLVNDDGNAFVGCENYGLVITDRANYKGTLFGQCNKAARFSDCIAQGDLGAYEDGSYALVGVNYTNYMSYIGDHNATAVHVNSQNILYYPNGSQVPAEPEFGVNLSSVELNAQGSNAAVVQLSSVDYDWTVSAALLDLGFIGWSNNMQAVNRQTSFEFNGFHDVAVKKEDAMGNPKDNSLESQGDRYADQIADFANLSSDGDKGSRSTGIGATMNLSLIHISEPTRRS